MTTSTSVERQRLSARRALLAATAILGAALAATSSFASETTGYVSHIYTMPGGQILFHTSDDRSRPACAVTPGRWAFDGTTPAGQARLAVVLTAYGQHKPIYVLGTGATPPRIEGMVGPLDGRVVHAVLRF